MGISALLLQGDSSLTVKYAAILFRSSLCRNNVIARKFSKGIITSIKAIKITSGESKSSNNGSAAMKMTKCKMMQSNLLRISLLYGFIDICIKSIIPQTTINM